MDMSFLKSFLVVAECRSLSQASEVLHLGQPALSRQIRLLEEEFGTRLFTRTGRGMSLTPAGLLTKARFEEILGQVDLAKSEVAAVSALAVGTTEIGMTPFIAQYVAAPLLSYFATHHPGVKLTIVEALSGHLCEWLRSGRLQLGILDLEEKARALHTEPLVTEDLCLIGPGGGSALGETVGFLDLPSYPLILTTSQHVLRRQIDQTAARLGVALTVAFEVDTFFAIRHLVLEGYGYAIAPARFVEPDLKDGTLSAARISQPDFRRTLYLAMSPHCEATLVVRTICHQIRQMMRMTATAPLPRWRHASA